MLRSRERGLSDHERVAAYRGRGIAVRVVTSAATFAAGARVAIDDDGCAVPDEHGTLEAYSDGAPGYCVTIGPPRPEPIDTPTRVVLVNARRTR